MRSRTALRRQVLKRQIAEAALENRLRFERVLIDGTPLPTYARDRQGRLLVCNKAYLAVFGLDNDADLLGTTAIEHPLADTQQAQQYHQDYLQAMTTNRPLIMDRTLILPNGEQWIIHHWILPYLGSDGRVEGLIAGCMDISERQGLIAQLRDAKHQADKANSAKTNFLSNMSHEIRTPMNAILGMLEIASRKAEQGILDCMAINVASDAAKGLLTLIGDILDISRIESGYDEITLAADNPRDLLMGVIKVFDGLARQSAISLVARIDPAINQYVLIDSLRFKQVVANLLSNAIKFTREGEVCISAKLRVPQTGESISVQVTIEDTGVGISNADQQLLFKPFSQVGAHNGSSGSGLGLAISRSLVEKMGGTLELTSEVGEGTRVDLAFEWAMASPSAVTPKQRQNIGAPPPLDGAALSVLIADDYTANRMVLLQQLTHLGHQVQQAENGQQAWALWSEQPFDVVVTDCNMPGINGYELTRLIRQQEHKSGAPPCLVIGFTASAVPEEKRRCINAGMDDCLFKPVSLQQLSDRLQALLTTCPGDTEATELSASAIQRHLSALCLEQPTLLAALKAELLSCTSNDIGILDQLIHDGDHQGLAAFAHRVKGGARLFHYEQLIVSCDNLSAACMHPAQVMVINERTATLKHCLEHVVACLKENTE